MSCGSFDTGQAFTGQQLEAAGVELHGRRACPSSGRTDLTLVLAGNNSPRLIRDIDSTARLDYRLARTKV